MSAFEKDVNISLHQIINLLPAQIYWLNTDMVFLGCNDRQACLFGLSSPEAIVGKRMFDFQTKETAHLVQAAYENSQQVIRSKKTLTFEEVFYLADGKKVVFLSEKSPLFDEEGNVIGLLGVSFDITEKKQLEDNKDVLLEEIISHLPGYVYWKNRQGVYKGCNDNQAKMLKFSFPKEIVGKTLYDLLPDTPEIAKIVSEEDEKIMSADCGKKFEENGINAYREPALYLTHKVPLHDHEGRVTGLLGLSFDITQRKQAEEAMRIAKEKAEAANLLKIEFIRNMEHDIRTPVSGLYGVVSLLLKQETNADKKEMLGVVADGLKEFLDYVNDILSFSRVEAETVPVTEKKFDLKKLIDSIANMELPTARHKQLQFKTDFSANLPRVVIGDGYRLKRILINLVSNALKFTHEGFVKLSAKLISQKNRQVILQFAVEDSGMGIPKKKQDYIYEKFMRGTLANQGIYKGSGLGLYIVKQFVHDMEGEIDLESQEGQGTTFVCTFPFKISLVEEILAEGQEQ